MVIHCILHFLILEFYKKTSEIKMSVTVNKSFRIFFVVAYRNAPNLLDLSYKSYEKTNTQICYLRLGPDPLSRNTYSQS